MLRPGYPDHTPFLQSAMRIMDCFLLEGIKFIFRTSLGILRMNQTLILQKKDPFVLFQFVKELAKHIFDIEGLYQVYDADLASERPFTKYVLFCRNFLSLLHFPIVPL